MPTGKNKASKIDSSPKPRKAPAAKAVVTPSADLVDVEAKAVEVQAHLPRIVIEGKQVALANLNIGDKFSASGELFEKITLYQWGIGVVRIRPVPGGFIRVNQVTMGRESLVYRVTET